MAVAPSPPKDLCVPRPGSTTGRAVITMATRQLFDVFKSLEIGEDASPGALAEYEKARAVLLGFLPGNPKAVSGLLRRPTISTPLRHLRDGSAPLDEALVEFAGQALFELALSGDLDAAIELHRTPPRLISVPHRTLLRSRGERVILRNSDISPSASRAPMRPAGLEVTVSGAHDQGWTYGIGEAPSAETLASCAPVIRGALGRIEAVSETMRHELDRFLPVIAVAKDASVRASIGLAFCAPRADVDEMAEVLVRAAGRQKMHAFLELDPLAESGEVDLILEAQERAVAAALHDGLQRGGRDASRARAASLRGEIAALLENAPRGDDLTPVGEAVVAELRLHREG